MSNQIFFQLVPPYFVSDGVSTELCVEDSSQPRLIMH